VHDTDDSSKTELSLNVSMEVSAPLHVKDSAYEIALS